MTLGQRIEARAMALGVTQSELARRVGVGSTTINGLMRGNARSTPHLFKIARALRTTGEYLVGEIDDPDEGAPPPPTPPHLQMVMMPVALPSEAALAEMYEGQLRAFARLQGAELARALAKRLPRALAQLQAADLYEETDEGADELAAPAPPAIDRPEPRQAQRR